VNLILNTLAVLSYLLIQAWDSQQRVVPNRQIEPKVCCRQWIATRWLIIERSNLQKNRFIVYQTKVPAEAGNLPEEGN